MKPENRGAWGTQIREQVRGYFLDNLPLKGLAALIVTALWLSVAGQRRVDVEETTLRNLDVTLHNPPSNLVITGTEPAKVDIRIRGPREQVRELRFAATLQASDVVPTADLSNIQDGVKFVPIRVTGLPEGVSLVNGPNAIEPPVLRVVLEPMRTRIVPVEARFSGQLPPGYRVVRSTVVPSSVTLNGAESYLKEVERLQTSTVNLNGHVRTFTDADVEVDIPAPDLYTAFPGRVSVMVEVEPESGDHTIDGIPVEIPGQSEATGPPPTVSVTLRGLLPALRALTPDDFKATVADDGRPPGRARPSQVVVTGPQDRGIEILRVRPESVTWKR